MTTQPDRSTLAERLETSPVHQEFVSASFFEALTTEQLTRDQVAVLLG